ncbi:MAG: 3-dehydroquinate synthase [Planctomycetota bacterium]|jgi:3-dehydroquinate synthase|nr:3-dehydroquinate synthase [Planctomycetota bacterium]
MKTVTVSLQERSYPIWIGASILPSGMVPFSSILKDWKHAFLLEDANATWFGDHVATVLNQSAVRCSRMTIPSGESSKSIDQLGLIWNAMLEEKTDRKSIVVAVGGGVVGDLAGFAAASFMRGLRFVQVPTTLLAMVDSSVGGKTGINLPKSKNMVGAFWQPHAVVADTHALETLPMREFISGLAEVAKYGVIMDRQFFSYLENNVEQILNRAPGTISYLVQRSCELKADVVSKDERETLGLRAILNYGHTFGHAIEACTSYGQYLHGEAISIGMTMAGKLAVDLGLWGADELDRQSRLLDDLRLPISLDQPVATEDLLAAMQSDKKNEHGNLTLILPDSLGHVSSYRDIPIDEVAAAIGYNRSKS